MAEFVTMSSLDHRDLVIEMMAALYNEDPGLHRPRFDHFSLTIEHLLANPGHGRIILLTEDSNICGYGLLVPFWSNEFGGTVLVVDEIYVRPDFRNRGIGRAFFAWLLQDRPYNAVALGLEVSPNNHAALRLYTSLGFAKRNNTAMTYMLTEDNGA
jgi:ribosomal protein S18 acetylase RimI-like enzyme